MRPQFLNISGRSVRLCPCISPTAAIHRALESDADAGAVFWSLSTFEGTAFHRSYWSATVYTALRKAGWPKPYDHLNAPRPLGIGGRTFWWSMSHSTTLGVFAMGDLRVAADVEEDRELHAAPRVAERMASADEWQLANQFFAEQPLLGLWTAKEAVSKGRGSGILEEFRRYRWYPIDADTSRIDVEPDSPAAAANAQQWTLWHHRLSQAWISFAMRADDA